MIFNLIKSLFIVLMMSMATFSAANAATLHEVISKYCRKDCVSAEQLTSAAKRAARGFKIDYRAVIAIVHTESKYHTHARNGSNVGLTQTLLFYHKKKFRGTNYFDVEDNIFAGMQVFSDCFIKMKGSYSGAFGCYNGGGDPKYTTKIMRNYAMIKELEFPEVHSDPLGNFITEKGVHHDRPRHHQEVVAIRTD